MTQKRADTPDNGPASRVYPLERLDAWREWYARMHDGCVFHSPEYIRFLATARDLDAELLVHEQDGEAYYYPYLKRPVPRLEGVPGDLLDIESSWYYGGPLASTASPGAAMRKGFAAACAHRLDRLRAVTEFIRFDANIANHGLLDEETLRHAALNRQTVFVNLEQSREKVESGFSGSNRRALAKAERAGIEVSAIRDAHSPEWENFIAVYDHEMQRKDAPGHLRFPRRFFDLLREHMGGSLVLLSATAGKDYCGGFVVIHDQKRAFHFLSASWPEYWDARVNNALFSQAVFWAHGQGLSRFDFLGGRPGVFRFKCNFSPLRGEFHVLKRVHDPERYRELARAAEADRGGTLDPNRFPVYAT